MGLTEHQEDILNQSLSKLETSDRLLIKGSAGVGKTYMVNVLVKRLLATLSSKKRVYCSAPTNKAVFVLKDKVDDHSLIDFVTIHSALKLKRNINSKTGEVTFKPFFSDKYPPLKNVSLLIVDESSMLNEKLVEYIEEYATRYSVKVIFIGDDKQLNPIGEDCSKVFEMGYPEVELTEIIRQGKDNPIINLSRDMEDIQFRQDNYNTEEEEPDHMTGYLHTRNSDKIIKELAKVNGTDELKYLSWTNRDVDTINFLVRQEIYGQPCKIEIGESLVFNSPYKEEFFTNEEIKVETLGCESLIFKYIIKNKRVTKEFEVSQVEFKVYYINGKLENGVPTGVLVIHEDSDNRFKAICKSLFILAKSQEIEWKDYFSFKEKFADLKYNHAISIHKSQGSTYQKAIVNVANINMNRNSKERKRLMYTAITRASDLLILYNS